jgi:hypothetical protein
MECDGWIGRLFVQMHHAFNSRSASKRETTINMSVMSLQAAGISPRAHDMKTIPLMHWTVFVFLTSQQIWVCIGF